MAKYQGQYEGEVRKVYKTVDNKKLSTLWIMWNNFYNIFVIAMMISVTSGLYSAYVKFTDSEFMWVIYILIALTALYALFYVVVLIYSHKEKDDDRAIRNVGYFRNIVNITKNIMSVFYVILTFVLLLDGWTSDIGLEAKWSYIVAAIMVGHSIISIMLQIYFFRKKMVIYKEKEEDRQEMKKIHEELREDIRDAKALLKHKEKDLELQKKSMMYRLWSLYSHRYVQPKLVEVDNAPIEDPIEEYDDDDVSEIKIIYKEEPEKSKENPEENPEEITVKDIFNQDETEYFYDAPDSVEDDSDYDKDEISISLADVISDYSTVFDFPDGKRRSDD